MTNYTINGQDNLDTAKTKFKKLEITKKKLGQTLDTMSIWGFMILFLMIAGWIVGNATMPEKQEYKEYKAEVNTTPAMEDLTTPKVQPPQNNVTSGGNTIVGILEKQKIIEAQKTEAINIAEILSNKIDKINSKNKIDTHYIQTFFDYCQDWEVVTEILAISGHETAFGATAPSYMQYNFFGFFLGGNKRYDPSLEELAKQMCKRFTSNNHYHGKIITEGKVDLRLAKIWSGNDRSQSWARAVEWFYAKLTS